MGCRRQHRQHSEPGKTLRQAGNKPEKYSHKPGPVQRACYKTYVGLWRIISAMQHISA